jgi:thioredoxin
VTAVEVTDATFVEAVLASSAPVIVDFWAPWCRPCKAIEPILDELVAATGGRLGLARVNVDENLAVSGRYGVLSLPTVILFAGGEPKATVVGAAPKRRFEAAFGEWL